MIASRYIAAVALTVALAGCVPASDGPPSSQGAGDMASISPTPPVSGVTLQDLERFDESDGIEVVVADDPHCPKGTPQESCYVPIFETELPPRQRGVEQALNCSDDRLRGCDSPVPREEDRNTVRAFCVTTGGGLDDFDGKEHHDWIYVEVPASSEEGAGERGFAFRSWFDEPAEEYEEC